MKRLVPSVIFTVLLVGSVIIGLSCAPQTELEISITQLENGVMIENVGGVDCLVFVNSPEDEPQLELAVGQNTLRQPDSE